MNGFDGHCFCGSAILIHRTEVRSRSHACDHHCLAGASTLNLKAYTDWMQDEFTTMDVCREADANFRDTTTFVFCAPHLEGTGCGLLQHFIAVCATVAASTCERTSCICLKAVVVCRKNEAAPRQRGSTACFSFDFSWVQCNLCGRTSLSADSSLRTVTEGNRSW